MFPERLHKKLQARIQQDALRVLSTQQDVVDFSSNDYLGFAKSNEIATNASQLLKAFNIAHHGATGSRLLTGNHSLYAEAEMMVARFHESETALIFNSGYDANIGFFQCVPQRGDVILYDAYIHASIRDGITMSAAKAFKFKHNNLQDIQHQLERLKKQATATTVYIVTESVFSMDGDTPDLKAIATLAKKHNAYLIVDEAHAIGVMGNRGQGLVQQLGLQEQVFARIATFGKALGAHGAAILGSVLLQQYLVNFARSFIYTTGLPPHSVAMVMASYDHLDTGLLPALQILRQHIQFFNEGLTKHNLSAYFIPSTSAIHCAIVPGVGRVKTLSRKLKKHHLDIKPILSPTVPEGEERLRICLHAFNTPKQIDAVLQLLSAELS